MWLCFHPIRHRARAVALAQATLLAPVSAFASWGEQSWGELVWGETAPPAVPALGVWGLGALGSLLVVTGIIRAARAVRSKGGVR